MSSPPPPPPQPKAPDPRKARLEQALRANLRRRKNQPEPPACGADEENP